MIKELRLFESLNVAEVSKELDEKPAPLVFKAVTFDTFTDACEYYDKKFNGSSCSGQRKIQTQDANDFRKLLL